jgi:hypothetical protein
MNLQAEYENLTETITDTNQMVNITVIRNNVRRVYVNQAVNTVTYYELRPDDLPGGYGWYYAAGKGQHTLTQHESIEDAIAAGTRFVETGIFALEAPVA